MRELETKNKEKLYFSFYSVLKNEDAFPYSDYRLLVAADGLGGAGSTVHKIDREKHKDLKKELYEAAFGDLNVDENSSFRKNWLDRWLEDMADEADDTSALWASRIAIGRFVYVLTRSKKAREGKIDLGNEEIREKIFRFVQDGLKNVAEHFDLQRGKYSNQLLLPTTLAAIRYEEKEDKIIAESVWAGDSRCYALTPDGLFALSDDDEDDSGAINNLFYLGENSADKVLHHRKFAINKPCVLMTVSDGIFDPYDPCSHFGVEMTLLKFIRESNNVEELKKALCSHYDAVHGDDSTMAFSAFGFESYQDMKEKFSERTDYVLSMWNKFREMSSKMSVAENGEEMVDYVKKRTLSKYEAIVSDLLKTLEGEADIAVPEILKVVAGKTEENPVTETAEESVEEPAQEIKENVEDSDTGTSEDKETDEKSTETVVTEEEKNRIIKALEALSDYMKEYPEKVCEEIFAEREFSMEETQIKTAIDNVKSRADKLATEKQKLALLWDKKGTLVAQKNEFLFQIKQKIEEYRAKFDELRLTGEAYELREQINEFAYQFGICELKLLRDLELTVFEKFTKEDKAFVKSINVQYFGAKRKLAENMSPVEISVNTKSGYYADRIEKLLGELNKAPEEAAKYFQEKIVEEFRLKVGASEVDNAVVECVPTTTVSEPVADGKNVEKTTESVLEKKEAPVDPLTLALSKKEEVTEGIVAKLAENYDKTSVIDRYYHPSRLSAFREYCRQQNAPSDEIKQFETELDELMKSYELFIRK